MIDVEGRPILIDFGIAKDILGPAITQVGRVVGTAKYMAPEHRKAEYIEPSADVFSISRILFELLTARPPWPRMSVAKELLRTVFDPPELDDVMASRIPADVLPIVIKGLSCYPQDRYPSALEALAALQATETSKARSVGFEEVREWVRSTGLPLDEHLEGMVIDSRLSKAGIEPASVAWDYKGRLREGLPPPRPTDTIPPSLPLTIPPLPPRRVEALLAEGATVEPENLIAQQNRTAKILGVLAILAALGFIASLLVWLSS